MGKKLPRSFYQRPTIEVARELLGKRLVRVRNGRRLSGIIVETEAYLGVKDAAAHTYGGHRSPRNEAMYGDGGHAYVYFIYGMHFCLNSVTRRANQPVAVLIRALEPSEGIELMRVFRKVKKDRDLANGPGKLCQALQIKRSCNGVDLTGDELFIEDAGIDVKRSQITAGPRIGVDYAGAAAKWPLRFLIKRR
jgi:DNA-3-methyladenine glycosylase